jgi:hypothetical protein
MWGRIIWSWNMLEGAPIARTDDIHTLLDQARQVADGLAAAHALGITSNPATSW